MEKKQKTSMQLDVGHRERLRNYIIDNYDTASKEKVFEYFMCMSIPRRDTRLLSKSILESVGGSINVLLNKDYNFLKNSLHLSKAVIASILTFKKMMSFCNEEELVGGLKLDSRDKIIKYFQREIGSKETEHLLVLFINSAQRLIEKKIFTDKNSSLTSLEISDIVAIALNNNARYVVISHNHPSGNVKPSSSDRISTLALEDTIKNINKFQLLDHVIVGPDKYYSFHENHLLKNNW